jgi:YD repeat-containing protein
VDDNCDGNADENCGLPGPPGPPPPPPPPPGPPGPPGPPPDPICKDKVGADPIVIASRAVVTEPFTDFSVQHVSQLAFTRTYNSANSSVRLGDRVGALGRGWNHEWEASLSCEGDRCLVSFGGRSPMRFGSPATALSTDGLEMLEVFSASADSARRHVLVRRPSGAWVLYLADGREFHFAVVCDACNSDEATGPICADPHAGGTARVTKIVDVVGNAISLDYDRPAGVFVRMTDQLGHVLELHGEHACADGLAAELRYDGAAVARYTYDGADLVRAVDADAHVLRSYTYVTGSGGLLQAVQNESGAPIAEFSYDADGRAIGITDERTTATIDYRPDGTVAVTEYFVGATGETSSTQARGVDSSGRVTSVTEGGGCGAVRTFSYSGSNLSCSRDEDGHIEYLAFDAQGRLTRQIKYTAASCPTSPPASSSLPADSRDESWAYASVARRTIAQGVTLDLDRVTRVSRLSGYHPSFSVSTDWDFDPAPKAIDPAGYRCTVATLPSGSVVCRMIATGRTSTAAAYTLERHATFYSYDERGRLIRTYGPVNLDNPSPRDVVPLEERTYWPDGAPRPNAGRLQAIKRYARQGAAPLIETFEYDAFGPSHVTNESGQITTVVRDGRGRPRFVTTPGAGTREVRYYDGLLPRIEVRPGGGATRSSYDIRGRIERVEYLTADPENGSMTPVVRWSEVHLYDAAGNRVHSERRDTAGRVAWQQDLAYDVRHRVVRDVNPEDQGYAKAWTYDAAGKVDRTADEESRTSTFSYDGVRRATKVRREGLDAQGLVVGLDVATYTYRPAVQR